MPQSNFFSLNSRSHFQSSQLKPIYRYSLVFFVLAILLVVSMQHRLGDFANYYFGSWLLMQDRFTTAVYDVASFNALIHDFFPGLFLNHATLPPLSAVVFVPFTYFDVPIAKVFFNAISAVIFCFALVRLSHRFLYQPLLAVALLAMPILSNLQQGQVYLLLFALLSEGYLALEKGNFKTVGVLWSFAIVLKLFPAILLLFLLLEKQFKALAFVLIACFLWILITLPFVPIDTWMLFAFEHVPRLLKGEINDPFSSTYQTFGVWLNQVLVHNDLFNPTPWRNWPIVAAILKFTIQLKLIFLLVLGAKKLKTNFEKFALYVFIGFFISGYSSTYALVFLGFPLIAFRQSFGKKFNVAFASILFLAISIPLQYYQQLGYLLGYSRLWLMLVAIVVLALYLQVQISKKHYLLFGLIFLFYCSFLVYNRSSESRYIVTQKSPILITDFRIENNKIIATFFNENGYSFDTTAFAYSSISTDTYLPNYNGPLYLVDDSYFVFLSDKQRGIGFTAIRKIYKQNVGEY